MIVWSGTFSGSVGSGVWLASGVAARVGSGVVDWSGEADVVGSGVGSGSV